MKDAKKPYLKEANYSKEREVYTYDVCLGQDRVGYMQLRIVPRKSDSLPEGFENNVYYEIDEPHRGHGYAKESLRLLLLDAKNKGLERLRIAVRQSNKPSISVIESLHPNLIKSGKSTEGEENLLYEVDL